MKVITFFFLIFLYSHEPLNAHEIYLKNGSIVNTDTIVEESDFVTYYKFESTVKISKGRILKIQYEETSSGNKKIKSKGIFQTSFEDYSRGNRELIMDPGFSQIFEIGRSAKFVLEYIEDQYVRDLFIYQNYKGLTKCVKDTYSEWGLPSNVKLERRIVFGPPMRLSESKLNEFIENEEARLKLMAEIIANNAEKLFYRWLQTGQSTKMLMEGENELRKLKINSKELTDFHTTLHYFVYEIKYGSNWNYENFANPQQWFQQKNILDNQYKMNGRPKMDLSKLK